MREQRIAIYDTVIEKCSRFERKGKANPYTASNGHMFSQINKDGQLGIRFSKKQQQAYFEEFDTGPFLSYGSVMRGYVLMPDWIWEDQVKMEELLNEGFDYVNTLEPK